MSRKSRKKDATISRNTVSDFSSLSKESLLAFILEQLLVISLESPEHIFLNDCRIALDPASSALATRYAVGRLKIYFDEMRLLRTHGNEKNKNSESYFYCRNRFFSEKIEKYYEHPKDAECLLRAVLSTFDEPKIIDLEK